MVLELIRKVEVDIDKMKERRKGRSFKKSSFSKQKSKIGKPTNKRDNKGRPAKGKGNFKGGKKRDEGRRRNNAKRVEFPKKDRVTHKQ